MHSNTRLTVDTTIRLRIATRIHFALLRHYGEQVDVAGLLRGDADAREALWVCEASGHAELVNLATQFNDATNVEAAADARRARRADREEAATRVSTRMAVSTAATRPAPQDAAWAQNTSGFGVSRQPEAADSTHGAPASEQAPAGWQLAARWLRRAAGR